MAQPAKLITVPVSHYVERARWALDLADVPYVEDMWPPVLHMKGTRFNTGGKSSSVPVLVTAEGEQIRDSGDIVKWVSKTYPDKAAHLYPQEHLEEIDKWEVMFSKRLGVFIRVLCYYHLFKKPRQEYLRVMTWAMPSWRRNLFSWLSYPFISMIKSGYRVNESNAKTCKDKVCAIFADVSKELSDGRPFLIKGTTQPTAADLTFAALSGPLLHMPNYAGKLKIDLCEFEPTAELLATPAGQHVLKMYTQYRMK